MCILHAGAVSGEKMQRRLKEFDEGVETMPSHQLEVQGRQSPSAHYSQLQRKLSIIPLHQAVRLHGLRVCFVFFYLNNLFQLLQIEKSYQSSLHQKKLVKVITLICRIITLDPEDPELCLCLR